MIWKFNVFKLISAISTKGIPLQAINQLISRGVAPQSIKPHQLSGQRYC